MMEMQIKAILFGNKKKYAQFCYFNPINLFIEFNNPLRLMLNSLINWILRVLYPIRS